MPITVLLHTGNKGQVKYGKVWVASYLVWQWVAISSRIEVLWIFYYFFSLMVIIWKCSPFTLHLKIEEGKNFQMKVVWSNLQLIVKKIYLSQNIKAVICLPFPVMCCLSWCESEGYIYFRDCQPFIAKYNF